MARTKPRSKAAKRAKVGKVLSEHKAKTLRSSSGKRVTSKKQAIAIALSEAGLARKKKKR